MKIIFNKIGAISRSTVIGIGLGVATLAVGMGVIFNAMEDNGLQSLPTKSPVYGEYVQTGSGAGAGGSGQYMQYGSGGQSSSSLAAVQKGAAATKMPRATTGREYVYEEEEGEGSQVSAAAIAKANAAKAKGPSSSGKKGSSSAAGDDLDFEAMMADAQKNAATSAAAAKGGGRSAGIQGGSGGGIYGGGSGGGASGGSANTYNLQGQYAGADSAMDQLNSLNAAMTEATKDPGKAAKGGRVVAFGTNTAARGSSGSDGAGGQRGAFSADNPGLARLNTINASMKAAASQAGADGVASGKVAAGVIGDVFQGGAAVKGVALGGSNLSQTSDSSNLSANPDSSVNPSTPNTNNDDEAQKLIEENETRGKRNNLIKNFLIGMSVAVGAVAISVAAIRAYAKGPAEAAGKAAAIALTVAAAATMLTFMGFLIAYNNMKDGINISKSLTIVSSVALGLLGGLITMAWVLNEEWIKKQFDKFIDKFKNPFKGFKEAFGKKGVESVASAANGADAVGSTGADAFLSKDAGTSMPTNSSNNIISNLGKMGK